MFWWHLKKTHESDTWYTQVGHAKEVKTKPNEKSVGPEESFLNYSTSSKGDAKLKTASFSVFNHHHHAFGTD